jgi:hypothetical protein
VHQAVKARAEAERRAIVARDRPAAVPAANQDRKVANCTSLGASIPREQQKAMSSSISAK